MKVFDKLILVSKASISEKLFDVDTSKLSKKELKKVQPFLPTPEEKAFMEVYRSNLPELARLQRKMSVCLDVEVKEMDEDRITFLYGRDNYTLSDPENAFEVSKALDRSPLDAVQYMISRKCVLKNGEPVEVSKLKTDELRLIIKIADKFFFRIFIT